jgi:hypothetical protein
MQPTRRRDADEETGLLDEHRRQKVREPTPLQRTQLSIVLLLQIVEPLTSHSIYPYVNQVRKLYLFLSEHADCGSASQ